ncbi:MAG: anti-sigma regulatory factor [Bacteroidetes bacterium]|nr:anti-sigma regulatory factor [Bacteroidota bacterium]
MDKSYKQSFKVVGRDFIHAGRVATEIKMILKQLGLNSDIVRRIAIASFEAEMNVVMYAKKSVFNLEVSPREIKIISEDEGPGIPDIELAMKEGYSTATSEMREMGFGAGMGLPNIKKNADVFNITSEVGKGTKFEIIVYIN